MRHEHYGGVRCYGLPYGRQRRPYAGIAGHLSVRNRHIQVLANQHPLPRQIHIAHTDNGGWH
jgi:hypothetical protein